MLRRQREPRGIAPEIFKAVDPTLLGVEDVHEHFVVIDHNPLARGIPVDGVRPHAMIIAELILDLARDGLEMRLGGAGADDEEVGQAGDIAQVDRNDVFGLLVRGEFRAESG